MQLFKTHSDYPFPIIARQIIGLFPQIINPFLGIPYLIEKSTIRAFDNWDINQKQQFVFMKIKENVEYAYSQIPFYQSYYNQNGFKPSDLKSFEDIKQIPTVNKSILLEYPLEYRCCQIKNAIRMNTGGSSGHTLDFLKDTSTRVNHGIAYITTIWEKIGYRNSDLTLVLIGANTVKDGIDFCFRSNAIRLDTYKEYEQSASKLKRIANRTQIKFLHGYPSIIYEFALYCDEHDHDLREMLKKSLKGAFLGSEYPHPVFRKKIEQVFNIETVSFYGHTEGAVLAWEKQHKFRYYPFQTYGFAEVNKEGQLIGSTYYNKASPFIRYNTEDTVSDPEIKDGFLISFDIKEGRRGEFVTDKNGIKISLTGLIFGRHHKLFNYCSHIQICQEESGKAIILYVPQDKKIEFDPHTLFDSSNVDIKFSFKKLSNPVKTKSGKLNLLVKPEQLEA